METQQDREQLSTPAQAQAAAQQAAHDANAAAQEANAAAAASQPTNEVGTMSAEQLLAENQKLQSQLAEARNDAAKSRNVGKQQAAETAEQQTINRVLAALGRTPEGDKKVSIDDVTTELQRTRDELNNERRVNKITQLASKSGADATRLLNWQPFMSEAAKLDLSAEGSESQLSNLIKAQVEQNSFLATVAGGTGAGKTGGDFTGGAGTPRLSLDDRIADAEAKGDMVLARKLKSVKLANMQ